MKMEDSKGKIGINLGGLDEPMICLFFWHILKSILVSKLAASADVKYWMILCF